MSETYILKKRLRKTWHVFFSRFEKLTQVQIQAIPTVLNGDNAIVISSTASGKTEAIVAPICEICLEKKYVGLVTLYICPTRALVNDLYERVENHLKDLNISIGIKTGDHPQINPKKPKLFLVTTPESFDSILCRYPKIFSTLRFVILDELHFIDNTYRGDQLRVLLNRLRGLCPNDLAFYAMSATFEKPEEVASRYFNPFKVIKVLGHHEIHYELINSANLDQGLINLKNRLRQKLLRKTLFFCNSRKETEALSQIIGKFFPKDKILVHHGSLSKNIREETERIIKEMHSAICICTMTLEVGIDIGDIDAVVLFDPPPSVSSLLQRIGRGNRRTNNLIAYGLYSNEQSLYAFNILFKHALEGKLEQGVYRADPSVAVQQILSILFQKRFTGVNMDEITKLLRPLELTREDNALIISHLTEKGFIDNRDERMFPSQKLMDLAERGKIHSNIPSEKGYIVIDNSSGRELGEVSIWDSNLSSLLLGGKVWKIIRIIDSKIFVARSTGEWQIPSFTRRFSCGSFVNLLPLEIMRRYIQ